MCLECVWLYNLWQTYTQIVKFLVFLATLAMEVRQRVVIWCIGAQTERLSWFLENNSFDLFDLPYFTYN